MADPTMKDRIAQVQRKYYASSGKDVPPLCAFRDEDDVHFYGDCADKAKTILGEMKGVKEATAVEGMNHLTVDLRYWNPTVEKLQAANEVTQITDL